MEEKLSHYLEYGFLSMAVISSINCLARTDFNFPFALLFYYLWHKANIRPEDKASYVARHQDAAHKVCMIGDGINDTAALAQANVSFAMGKGAAVAMETADVTLLQNDLKGQTLLVTQLRNTEKQLQIRRVMHILNPKEKQYST